MFGVGSGVTGRVAVSTAILKLLAMIAERDSDVSADGGNAGVTAGWEPVSGAPSLDRLRVGDPLVDMAACI